MSLISGEAIPINSSSSFVNALWKDVDKLMSLITPTRQSNETRDAVASYLKRILQKGQVSGNESAKEVYCRSSRQHSFLDGSSCGDDEGANNETADDYSILLMLSGSCCSKTYLPDGDIDLVMITHSLTELSSIGDFKDLTSIFSSLCAEICRKEQENKLQSQVVFPQTSSTRTQQSHQAPSQVFHESTPEYTVRNVEFINARTKLLHCLVDSYSVDITLNQIGIIASMLFIEEVDREIGENHLFKRSILLIKCWCLHESRLYCGLPIIGSKEGMFSSYAISIMVMHLFNLHRESLHHPLEVLRSFLSYYQKFPWETHVLTLEGPYPIQIGGNHSSNNNQSDDGSNPSTTGSNNRSQGKHRRCINRFFTILDRLGKEIQAISPLINENLLARKKLFNPSLRFTFRACNIQDPVDDTNNLGFSVARNNLPLIERAFQIGSSRLEGLFANCYASNSSATVATAVPPPLLLLPLLQTPQQPYHNAVSNNNSNPNNNMNNVHYSVFNSPNHGNHIQPVNSSMSNMSPSCFPHGNNDNNSNNIINNNMIGNAGNTSKYNGSNLPFYPFLSIPQRSTTSNATNITVPLPPPLFTPLTSVTNNSNTSSKYVHPVVSSAFLTQPHPIDSFFALSLQHYSMYVQQPPVATDDSENRRQSFSTMNYNNAIDANNNFSCRDGETFIYKDLSPSDISDSLLTNQDILFLWLKRAEALAHRHQLHPLVTSSEADSLRRYNYNENLDTFVPTNIKPVDVSSPSIPHLQASCIPAHIIVSNKTNLHYFLSHKEDIDANILRKNNSNTNDNNSKRYNEDTVDVTLSQGDLRRSPSPSSSTCSSLSSAITTLPESLDPHQPSPDQLSSSSALHPHIEPLKMTDTSSTTLCSEDNRRDSLSSTDDIFPYEENHYLKESNLHRQNINNLLASSMELLVPDFSEHGALTHQHESNNNSFFAININNHNNNNDHVLSNNSLFNSHGMGEKLTKSQQKRLKQQQQQQQSKKCTSNTFSNNQRDRIRTDSVQSQNSVNSLLPREEKRVNEHVSGKNHVNLISSKEEIQAIWYTTLWNGWMGKLREYFVHNYNNTANYDTNINSNRSNNSNNKRIKTISNGVQSAVVLAAVQRRHQLQQQHHHAYSWTVYRGWAALMVAALSLTGIVVLNVYTERPNSRYFHPTNNNNNNKTLENNNSVLSTWTKESQAYFSQLNLTSSFSSTVTSFTEQTPVNNTNIYYSKSSHSNNNVTENNVLKETETEKVINASRTDKNNERLLEDILFWAPSVPTHWVQVGESLIFGHDLQHLGNDCHPLEALRGRASGSGGGGHDGMMNVDGSAVWTSLRGTGNSVAVSNIDNNNNNTDEVESYLNGYYYLWTRDDFPVSISAQPLLTIPQTVLTDSGHYRCYEFMPFSSQQIDHHRASASLWQPLTVFAAFLATDTNEDTAVSQQSPSSLPQRQLLLQRRSVLEKLLLSFTPDILHNNSNNNKVNINSYWREWLTHLPHTATVLSAKQIPRFLQLSHNAYNKINNNKMVSPWSEGHLQELFSSPMMMQHFSHDGIDEHGTAAYKLVTETRISVSKKPRVRNRPFYQEIKQGRPFYLPLEVEAIPAATFQWFKNGYPLSDQRQSVLLLEAVDVAATGTYSCEVQNIAGKILWLEATIHVVD